MIRNDDTEYHVTGVDVYGKRFSYVIHNRIQALCINLYRGSVWIIVDGKRKLLRRVYN